MSAFFHLSDKFQIMLCAYRRLVKFWFKHDFVIYKNTEQRKKSVIKRNVYIGSIIKHTHERVASRVWEEKCLFPHPRLEKKCENIKICSYSYSTLKILLINVKIRKIIYWKYFQCVRHIHLFHSKSWKYFSI